MLYKIGGVHICSARTVFMYRQRMKDLLLRARVVVRTSNMKISRRYLPDYVKTLHPKACSTNIFLHSTNQIIDCGVVVDVAVVKSKRNFIHVTGTATTTPQIKNLIGRVSENKRAARTYVQVRAILCKTTT